MKQRIAAIATIVMGWVALSACGQFGQVKDDKNKSSRGKPMIVGVDEEANPDVMWVIMPVGAKSGTKEDKESKVFWGLYSCHRSPASSWPDPKPPVCHLARMEGSLDDLNWPGAVILKDGKLTQKK